MAPKMRWEGPTRPKAKEAARDAFIKLTARFETMFIDIFERSRRFGLEEEEGCSRSG